MIQSAQEKRVRARRLAELARRKASDSRPQHRAEVRAWLDQIRDVLNEMRTGEIDAVRGYAITRIHFADEDYARVDHCINGFTALLDRLPGNFDSSALKTISRKLSNGILLSPKEVNDGFVTLLKCEDFMLGFSRLELRDYVTTERINIELELAGIKKAA